jgi:hypothetical protein
MQLTSTRVVEPATAEYVLAVIRDSHRQQCEYDPEAEADIDLTFDSTIAEWRMACDLLAWRPLSRALDKWFSVKLPASEWKDWLEPASEKRMGRLCEAIARRATRERVIPKNILGNPCQSASVFLAVRELLEKAGADVSCLRPDAAVAEYARDYPGVFLDELSRLYPGRLPLVRISTPVHNILAAALVILLLISGLCRLLGYWSGVAWAAVGALAAVFGLIIASILPPKSVSFGNVTTFRDLVNALIAHEYGRAHRIHGVHQAVGGRGQQSSSRVQGRRNVSA